MNDSLKGLLLAIAIAVGAWLFWHFLGEQAFTVIALTLAALFVDNRRLRRRLSNIPLEQ